MKEVKPSRPSNVAWLFPVKVARSVGNLMQRAPYADDQLLVSLGNSLKQHEQSVRESRTLRGRFRSLFARRIDPENIEIDGMRLQQLLVVARSKQSIDISVSKIYALDLTTFRSLLKSAAENLNEGKLGAKEEARD